MTTKDILCGRISYINVLPLFYPLEAGFIEHPFTFVYAPPAELNLRIRKGELALSGVSCVEYIFYASQYRLIPDLAIASATDVRSVLLFSHIPIEELDNKTIALTSESNTSVLLLRLLCAECIGIKPEYIQLEQDYKNIASAYLLIGDQALITKEQEQYQYVYDLGSLWYEWTKLPFVFAVWIAPYTNTYPIEYLAEPFYLARAWSEKNIERICEKAKEISGLTDKTLKEYYASLRYSFGVQEQESLYHFAELLYKHSYCTVKPEAMLLK